MMTKTVLPIRDGVEETRGKKEKEESLNLTWWDQVEQKLFQAA